jgi:hypothetical protein
MAHWIVLFLVVAVRPLPEPCQQHGPPFAWRAKIYDAAMDGKTRLQPPPRNACVLVRA